jgi:glycosyltransferase involved in cell wall biosynthesis
VDSVTFPLSIAVVKDGEPFPVFCSGYPMRAGNLATELASRGHAVVWHASTFRHYGRDFVTQEQVNSPPEQRFQIRLHECGGYQKTVSLDRFLHHARLGRAVFRALRKQPKLDGIYCCVPTLESAAACLLVSKMRKVPLLLDIRDAWPEAFLFMLPRRLEFVARAFLFGYSLLAKTLFRYADSLTAICSWILDWAHSMSNRSTIKKTKDQVLYLGSHDLYAYREAPSQSNEDRPLSLIYMGGFSQGYEFETLLKALETGLGNNEDFRFYMVGAGGDHYESLKSSMAPFENVIFTGWLPRDEAYTLAGKCQIGYLPLRSTSCDFFPNKPFEYTSLGLCLLFSGNGEIQTFEQSGCGFHYLEGEVEKLVQHLTHLRSDPQGLQQAQEKSRAFWVEKGNAKTLAKTMACHLTRLIESSGPSPR